MEDADQTMILANYALNALWILLPLVPSVLIYLIFPKSQASAKGLFAGLTIRAGGAFAAYFIVLLASYPVLNGWNTRFDDLLRPSWEITGTVQIEDEEGKEISYEDQEANPLKISMTPDLVTPIPPNRFRAIVPEIQNRVPAIYIQYRGYGVYTLDPTRLREGEYVKIDHAKKLIEITSPLVIRRKPCLGISCEPQP
jgi:hypothetical protein